MKKVVCLGALLVCLIPSAWAGSFAPLDRQSAKALTDPVRHTAPTIVAFWSSDCGHCKKNLDLFARMAKTDPRLRLITVAAETEVDGLAVPLDRLGVPGQRYAYGTEAPEAIAFALDPRWRGELPRTLFFDGRGGKMAVTGVVDEAAVRQSLKLDDRRH